LQKIQIISSASVHKI